MESADVVVIGAGVIGASVAYHLAAAGCGSVRVLDANSEPGQGSTCKATGGFRAQFGSETNVRLSLLSREKLLRFPDEIGADPGYRECGYLFLSGDDSALGLLAEARETQRAAGFRDARAVDREEIARLNPDIVLDGVTGGSYCPSDGFIRPLQIAGGYVEAARRLGVHFDFGVRCTGFGVDGDRITAVHTGAGDIDTGAVVNAGGAWAGALARMAGVDVPVVPLRRQVACTVPTDALPEDMPLTIFIDTGFHMRVRDGRVLLLYADVPGTTDPFDARVDDDWVRTVAGLARTHVPSLRNVAVDREGCWGGLYEMSPDGHALLGAAPGLVNFYLANGSSGHGVMHSPALGQLLAEIMLEGRATSMDVAALRPERFLEGHPNVGSTLL